MIFKQILSSVITVMNTMLQIKVSYMKEKNIRANVLFHICH